MNRSGNLKHPGLSLASSGASKNKRSFWLQKISACAGVGLLAFLAVSSAFGQSYYGGIRGRVADAQGAVIANAKVSITDDATNVVTRAISNTDGEYVFSSVNPATYTIAAENAGFKKYSRKVIVGTQEFITLDLKLEVGEVTESVNVTEEVPLMETSNASQGTLLDRQKLTDLPNIGRNPFIMAWITPGVVPAGDPRFARMQDQSGSSYVSFGGGPLRGNVYLLDGVPITDGINRAVIVPTLEAVQEVKIQLNTYDAELGRYAGGVYNTFLKSGSNDVHGALMGYARTTSLFANDFFANRNGQARADQPYKNFGFAGGGPIYIPKIYNGKNKTFIWLAFEGYRQRSGQFTDAAVPTAAEKSGNFSSSRNADGTLKTIFDPLTTRSNGRGGFIRDPFPGNTIPSARINPISANIARYFPDATRTANAYGAPNRAVSAVLVDRANQATGKLDHEFRPWFRMNFAYLHYGSKEPGPDWYGSPASPGAWFLVRYADVSSVNATLTPTPTTVIALRYGYNRFPNDGSGAGKGFNSASLGFPTSFLSQIQGQRFPDISFENIWGFGRGGDGYSVPNSKSFFTSVSKFSGRHNWKFGFQHRVINWPNQGLAGPGGFSFSDTFTRRDPINKDGSGADLASFLLGFPGGGGTSLNGKFDGTFKYYAGYLHDDFRLRPGLTINMGIRYDWEEGYRDRGNALVTGFDTSLVNPIQAQLPAGSGVTAYGGLRYAGLDGQKNYYGNPSKTRFAPRVGIAWQVDSKTTIRGGYGLFWAPPIYGSQGAPGFGRETPFVGTVDGGLTPFNTLSNPYPSGLLPIVGNGLRTQTGIGGSVAFWNPQMSSGGYVNQYSIDIQRTLPKNINFSIAFVGSLSRNMNQNTAGLNINQLDPSLFAQGNSLLAQVPNPFFNLKDSAGNVPGFFASPTISRAQLLKPYPAFDSVTMLAPNGARARYESIQFRGEKRFSGGLTFLSHLTWSKNRDMAFAGTNFSSSNGFVVQNAYNYDAEYSLAANNTPLRFVTTTSWELPFGKGKKFFANSKIANYTVGGWQLNIISTYQSGFPLSVGVAENLNGFAGAGQRPNATGSSPKTSGPVGSRLDGYIKASAFAPAARFTFGNLSRTIPDRAPGQANWDVSLFKSVQIRERVNLQFRAEAMNFANTARFNPPGGVCTGCGSFGYITQQANFPRFIQLGGRISF